MGENNLKGRVLEDAVESLLKHIVAMKPAFSQAMIKIEPRKIINVENVKKEIDLYVEIDLGNGLSSVFIYECRNRKKNVAPKDIADFLSKIEDVKATKGFFVARGYSQFAKNEANRDKNKRIVCLSVEDMGCEILPFPVTHTMIQGDSHMEVEIVTAVNDNKLPLEEIAIRKITLRGQEVDANSFMTMLRQDAINEKMKHENTHCLDEGIYNYSYGTEFSFKGDELCVNEVVVNKLVVSVEFVQQIVKPTIVANYDIETKGRYIKLVTKLPNGEFSTELVATL